VAPLVLSLFPGIGLLDRAFEEEGFTVVRGPDVLWGGDVRRFHPPAGVFDGVIGGPPCQMFSRLAHLGKARGTAPKFGNLIPEFERCVVEAKPTWFLMENVEAAPLPDIPGYACSGGMLNNRWVGGEQHRERRFTFGGRGATPSLFAFLEIPLFESSYKRIAVTSVASGYSQTEAARFAVTGRHSGKPWKAGRDGLNVYSLEDACELQGLPRDFCEEMPFTAAGKLKAVANGVPLPMGRAIARAVNRAMYERAA
jgi:DNA (cytosine-5)-methyltransferase 1